MIAITALLATVVPNVGPTDFVLKPLGLRPKWLWSADCTRLTPLGPSVLDEIWKTVGPRDLLLICCTTGFGAPAALTTELTWGWVAGLARGAVICVPEVKSIPRLSPRP